MPCLGPADQTGQGVDQHLLPRPVVEPNLRRGQQIQVGAKSGRHWDDGGDPRRKVQDGFAAGGRARPQEHVHSMSGRDRPALECRRQSGYAHEAVIAVTGECQDPECTIGVGGNDAIAVERARLVRARHCVVRPAHGREVKDARVARNSARADGTRGPD